MDSPKDFPYDCPRCGAVIETQRNAAVSRVNTEVLVCSACGTHEALLQFEGDLESQDQWPVEVPHFCRELNDPVTWAQWMSTVREQVPQPE